MSGTIEEDNIRQPPHYRDGGPPQVVTADTVRQGPLGKRVLVVLVVSVIGAAIAFFIAGIFWSRAG